MVEALSFFCKSLLSWISYAVPSFVEKIDIVDFGIVSIVCLAIIIFVRSIGGKKNG